MPSPSELHFEGQRSTVQRRWLVVAAIVVVAILVGFAKSTLPTQRGELIGRWQDIIRKDCFYEFRADGTYTSVVPEDWLASAPNPRGRYQGRWKATPNALYLTHEKIEFTGDPKFRKSFNETVKNRIGLHERLNIEWPSDNQWTLSHRASQTLQRVIATKAK